ncbi:DoxX family protein [Marinifilum caeruleilacunae]|uniref:DoxX family protein n=1 Tax=Marinifilum caeruleilacunae TaxID=2499076 RepID=A0ABX1WUN1_9BACT|nr:DoxX family protein [Marinifilum caeruleilacunae]NOU59808.1 DoxX family protein [Marinifilum caeruleilacunae]
MKEKRKYRTIEMLLRIVTAIILIQTLHFKFSGHPQAIHVFSTIGMEPWGRYGIGAIELITGILFFLPNYWKYASVITAGLMIGAIGFHLVTPLGVVVEYDGISDGGQLFAMAITALVFSCILMYRANVKDLVRNLLGQSS